MSEGMVLGERPGAGRVVTPLSEAASVGMGVGLALAGRRVVVELAEVEGVARAADALADVATMKARSQGAWSAPVVITVPLRPGDELPAVPEGVRVGVAAGDPAAMVEAAQAGSDPAVIFVAAGPGSGAPGVPARLREGDGATVLAFGHGVAAALDAADKLAADGVAVDVIDLRGVAVVGEAAASVRRTGRVVVVGHGAGVVLAAVLGEGFWSLEAPPRAVRADAGADAVVGAIHDVREA